VIDNNLVAVSMVNLHSNKIDIRYNNMKDVQYRLINIPNKLKVLINRLIKSYRLRFAAIDFVVDKRGKWYFLEINPNGQWAWLDIEIGTDIGGLILSSLTLSR